MGKTAVPTRPGGPPAGETSSALLRVSVPLTRAAESTDMLALARKHAFDPAALDEHPPYFVTANISNGLLDAYGTKMHESSLRNYADDAEAGVAVLQSHNARELPLGRSIAGRFVAVDGEATARVEADAYIAQGLRLGSVDADQVIAGIRTGIVHDVSIGFYGGDLRCSVCGLSYWDWDCWHVPGVEYPVTDAKGNETGRQVAFVWIHDARLAEFSFVYDGATPQAEIVAAKAQQEADAGRLRPETARLLELRYRIHLPASATRRAWATTREQEVPMPDENEERAEEQTERAEPEAAASTEPVVVVDDGEARVLATLRQLADANGGQSLEVGAWVRGLVEEVGRLRPLADDGRAYRADLLDEMVREGVRALGEAFPAEAYREQFAGASLATIKAVRDSFKAQGDRRFPGGRATTDGDDLERGGEAAEEAIPADAYRA